jgi:predicted dehydrogenase
MDKPAGKLGEFRALLKKAQKKALVVQMGYMYRYNPAILKCLEYIKSGELGEIYSINAEMSTFHSAEYRGWLKNFNGGIMYILGSHLIDLIVYMMGKPKKTTSLLKNSCRDGVVVQDNNLAVLEYERALARINVSSVEVNGWGRRQFVVAGSKGTVEICPLENPTRMTYSNLSFNNKHYSDVKENVQINEVKMDCRYDQMMQDFYAFVKGEKQNPFTYSHDYTVQKVINKIVKGVKFYGNNID